MFYEQLAKLAISQVCEGLTKGELEIFDLVSKDTIHESETQKVKLTAKVLLRRILEEHSRVLVEDWLKEVQTRKVVRDAVEQVLDENLPESLTNNFSSASLTTSLMRFWITRSTE